MAYDKSLIKTALRKYENLNQRKFTVSFEISNRDVYLDDLEHLLHLSVDFKKAFYESLIEILSESKMTGVEYSSLVKAIKKNQKKIPFTSEVVEIRKGSILVDFLFSDDSVKLMLDLLLLTVGQDISSAWQATATSKKIIEILSVPISPFISNLRERTLETFGKKAKNKYTPNKHFELEMERRNDGFSLKLRTNLSDDQIDKILNKLPKIK